MKELKNFSTVRKCTKGVKVKHENLLPEHQLTRLAERELMSLQGVVSMELYGILLYHVRGFDEDMQMVMAENLVDFAEKNGCSYFQLKEANLWLRDDKLVNKAGKTYTIIIPSDK